MENAEIAKNTLKKCQTNVDQAEVYIVNNKHLKIDVREQKTESINEVTDAGLAIRIIKDNKLG